jgi:hypothetical protein
MPIIDYPFTRLGPDSPFQPFLTIEVVNPKNGFTQQMPALIDTGADECTIPGFYAGKLGLPLKEGKPKPIDTASGDSTAYGHRGSINIFAMAGTVEKPIFDYDKVIITIPTGLLDFAPDLRVSYALLGVENFLKEYILTIDYPRRVLSIRKP